MRLAKLVPALVLVLFLFHAATGVSYASKAGQLVSQAEQAVEKAQAAKSAATRDENYKKALDTYNKVIREHANTLEAVQAQYGVARIHQTAKGKNKNLYQAYHEYSALITRYDKPTAELEQNFETPEIRRIRQIVASSETNKQKVAQELNEQNSHKILYKIMDFFVYITGKIPGFSYWFAIILVTVIVKLAITPLTKAQFKAMKEMQRVAPQIKEIQEKYKGDQKTIGEKTMALYKEHNINPFASCLPIIVQMPVLWLLYAMIRTYEFQFAKASFLWIGSGLSHLYGVGLPGFFTAGGQVWFTAKSLAEPDLVLVVLYVISMFISTRLSAVDPTQAEQQKMMSIVMPLMFAFIFASFPSAFLLYWLVFNILQTAQQYYILHGGQPEPAAAPVAPPEEPEAPRRVRRPRRRRRR